MNEPTAILGPPTPRQIMRAKYAARPGINLTGLATLFWLTLRQHARARKLVILSFLFILANVLALLVRAFNKDVTPFALEFAVVLNVIPHVMITLTALLYASAMIQDEIEEQTLTYLLIRPLPKWAIYLTKLLATLVLVILFAAFFTVLTEGVIHWGSAGWWQEVLSLRVLKIISLMALLLVAYCSLFGCLSLFLRHMLIVGLIYSLLFEGFLANVDFAVRRVTVIYWFRILAERWLPIDWAALNGVGADPWSMNLAEAPTNLSCVQVLAGGSLILTASAALAFTVREFHVKTPEGS